MSYDEIVPNLFVGDATSAQSFNGVIVNVLESWPQGEPPSAIWMPVLDLGNRASRARLDQVAATIDASLAMGMRVLVHCTTPGTIVGAPVPSVIETPPSSVIGADGREHPITDALSHHYSGDLVRLVARGIPPFSATPEHRFLVYQPYREPSGQVYKPNWGRPHSSSAYLGLARHDRTQPEWVEAAKLQPGDALLSPYWQSEPYTIGLPFAQRIEHPNSKPINVPELDGDIAWLCGLYAGDGYTLGRHILGLTLSKTKDVQRARQILGRFGRPVTVDDRPTYSRLRINSTTLATQFSTWFGRSSVEKHLPPWLMQSPFRFAALEGLLAADGYIPADRPSCRLQVVSQVLAWQTWHLLVSQGHRPTIHESKRHSGYANAKPIWEVAWTVGGKHHRTFHWNGYYGLPLVRITWEPYDGDVHTLTVPEGESYLTNGVISHNCGAGVERSGLAVAWLLYTKRGMTLPQAYALVQSRRPVVQDRTAWIAA